jgi:hypothetical protein
MSGADTICPCCNGRKGWWQHFEDVDLSDHVADDVMCECGPLFHECSCCEGTGELVGLKRAILLARGDIAPIHRRGHA